MQFSVVNFVCRAE